MSNQHKDDEYWMNVINSCRTSGLSDNQWCKDNGINPSTFYYHVKCLREKACMIPASTKASVPANQEVVQIFESGLEEVPDYEHCVQPAVSGSEPIFSGTTPSTAIRIDFHGILLEITNSAESSVIADTLKALRQLC